MSNDTAVVRKPMDPGIWKWICDSLDQQVEVALRLKSLPGRNFTISKKPLPGDYALAIELDDFLNDFLPSFWALMFGDADVVHVLVDGTSTYWITNTTKMSPKK